MFRKHVIQQLSAHLHGDLSAEESARIETHLRDCAKCRSANEEIRLGASLASRLSPSAAPEFSWLELRKGSRISDGRPIRRTVFAVAGLAFAAVLALVVFMMR